MRSVPRAAVFVVPMAGAGRFYEVRVRSAPAGRAFFDADTGVLVGPARWNEATRRATGGAVLAELRQRGVRVQNNPGPRRLPLVAEDDEGAASMLAWAKGHRSPAERGATLRKPGDPRSPLVVSYGMGVDSTAVLVALVRSGLRPGAILFADTGGEQPHTYDYLPVIQGYLARHGFPPVTVVRYQLQGQGEHGTYTTLEQSCLVNMTLPSIAYGFQKKKCSEKWKIAPQERWTAAWAPAQQAWAHGLPVVKAIGYDAGPADLKRGRDLKDDAQWLYWYPLRELGWDRARCKAEIAAEGLLVPQKSACFFCPAQKPEELAELARSQPHLARRIEMMEHVAGPYLTAIEGLWGTGTKGTAGGEAKPGTMSAFLEAERTGVPWTPPPATPRRARRTREQIDADEAREEIEKADRQAAMEQRRAEGFAARGRIDVFAPEYEPTVPAEILPGVPWTPPAPYVPPPPTLFALDAPTKPKRNPARAPSLAAIREAMDAVRVTTGR